MKDWLSLLLCGGDRFDAVQQNQSKDGKILGNSILYIQLHEFLTRRDQTFSLHIILKGSMIMEQAKMVMATNYVIRESLKNRGLCPVRNTMLIIIATTLLLDASLVILSD